jgi:hypothetical protein
METWRGVVLSAAVISGAAISYVRFTDGARPATRTRAKPTVDEFLLMRILAGEPGGEANTGDLKRRMLVEHQWTRDQFWVACGTIRARGWATSVAPGEGGIGTTGWIGLTGNGGRILALQD